ncbi:hypothetical protein B0H15DRAFT_948049 [Mycena belliarum]|uniref:Uncharacterized protein n=1 Tax=Mycena belliarum TaxID=1033014 RepID=A0AAD6UAX9_9AGAR|nr:hypothetical protein B0H15DRAFT_948049 [Mycena belliae]
MQRSAVHTSCVREPWVVGGARREEWPVDADHVCNDRVPGGVKFLASGIAPLLLDVREAKVARAAQRNPARGGRAALPQRERISNPERSIGAYVGVGGRASMPDRDSALHKDTNRDDGRLGGLGDDGAQRARATRAQVKRDGLAEKGVRLPPLSAWSVIDRDSGTSSTSSASSSTSPPAHVLVDAPPTACAAHDGGRNRPRGVEIPGSYPYSMQLLLMLRSQGGGPRRGGIRIPEKRCVSSKRKVVSDSGEEWRSGAADEGVPPSMRL